MRSDELKNRWTSTPLRAILSSENVMFSIVHKVSGPYRPGQHHDNQDSE
jgi:hypothetical protein